MSFLDKIKSGVEPKPRKTLLYGVEGIGKSSFMARWPDPVFVSTEDGLSDIDCSRFPEATSFADVSGQLAELYTQPHSFKTVVIDSAEGLESLIFRSICEENKKDSIEDFGYGKGYKLAVERWKYVLSGLDALNQMGLHVGIIGHANIERFENPETDSYDRYTLRVNRHAAAAMVEWATEVLFATYKVTTKSEDKGFNKIAHKALGTGQRVIKTTARPAYQAKNRLGLPDEMALDFSVYSNFLERSHQSHQQEKQATIPIKKA